MNYTELLKQLRPYLEKLDQHYAQRDAEILAFGEHPSNEKDLVYKTAKEQFTSRVIEKPYFKLFEKFLTPLKFKYSYQGCRFDYITSSPYAQKKNGETLWYCNRIDPENGIYNKSDDVIYRGVLFQLYAMSYELKDIERSELKSLIALLVIKIGLRFRQTFAYVEEKRDQYSTYKNTYRIVSEHLTLNKVSILVDAIQNELFVSPDTNEWKRMISIRELSGAPRVLTVETEPREQVVVAYSNEDIMEAITSLSGERKPTIREINERLGNKISDTTLRERIVKSMKKGDLISMRSRKTKAEVVKDDEKSNRIDKKYDNLK